VGNGSPRSTPPLFFSLAVPSSRPNPANSVDSHRATRPPGILHRSDIGDDCTVSQSVHARHSCHGNHGNGDSRVRCDPSVRRWRETHSVGMSYSSSSQKEESTGSALKNRGRVKSDRTLQLTYAYFTDKPLLLPPGPGLAARVHAALSRSIEKLSCVMLGLFPAWSILGNAMSSCLTT
jgi:hypothetical protein